MIAIPAACGWGCHQVLSMNNLPGTHYTLHHPPPPPSTHLCRCSHLPPTLSTPPPPLPEPIYPSALVVLMAFIIVRAFALVMSCALDTLFVCCVRDKKEYKGERCNGSGMAAAWQQCSGAHAPMPCLTTPPSPPLSPLLCAVHTTGAFMSDRLYGGFGFDKSDRKERNAKRREAKAAKADGGGGGGGGGEGGDSLVKP